MSTTDVSPKSVSELEAEIATQTARFNELRLAKQPLDEAKQTLSELKKALALAKNAGKPKEEKKKAEGEPEGDKKKKERILLKTAKVRNVRLTHPCTLKKIGRVRAIMDLQRCT